MASFHQIMDIMRNDSVKRVYNEDNGMSNLLDNDNLISVGGNGNPSGMGNMSSGLFNTSPRGMTMDMNKEERFSRKVFVGGLPPDIDEGIEFIEKKSLILKILNRGNHCTFSTFWSLNCRLAA